MPEVKAGWRTSEFWMSLVAAAIGLLMASGVVPDESGFSQALGVAAAALASAGYSVSRGKVKSSA